MFSSTTKSVLNDEEWEANKKLFMNETDTTLVRKKGLEILEEHRTFKSRLCDALRTQHALENEVHSLGMRSHPIARLNPGHTNKHHTC